MGFVFSEAFSLHWGWKWTVCGLFYEVVFILSEPKW